MYSKNNKNWFEKLPMILQIVIGFLGIIFGYVIGKNLVSKFAAGLAVNNVNKNLDKNIDIATNPKAIRETMCKSIVDGINKELTATFWTNDDTIKSLLDQLQNKEEVVWTASYFEQIYSKNLKATLVKAMGNTGTTFKDLSDLVKFNLL